MQITQDFNIENYSYLLTKKLNKMKKIVFFLMFIVPILGFSQAGTMTLGLPQLTGVAPGATIQIPVTVDDVVPAGLEARVGSFFIYVMWDDDVLSYVSATLSPTVAAKVAP